MVLGFGFSTDHFTGRGKGKIKSICFHVLPAITFSGKILGCKTSFSISSVKQGHRFLKNANIGDFVPSQSVAWGRYVLDVDFPHALFNTPILSLLVVY